MKVLGGESDVRENASTCNRWDTMCAAGTVLIYCFTVLPKCISSCQCQASATFPRCLFCGEVVCEPSSP